MLRLAMLFLLAVSPGHMWLYGTIRASDSGEPVAGALIEVSDESLRTWSDSGGGYRLEVSAGTHVVRVWRPGFDARTVQVLAGADTAMRLDITLTPRPVTLSAVRVFAATRRASLADSPWWPGSRRFSAERLRDDPALADGDVLLALNAAPGVAVAPELPTALHVRGGSADQNVILLDGVPLYNPYHAGGVLSAVNPDLVSSVTVDAGVAPSRVGDAVSGVVAISSRDPGPVAVTSRGAIGPLAARAMVGGPLPGVPGTFEVSGRRSAPALLVGVGGQGNAAATFGDLFARGSLDLGRDTVEVFSFSSSDRLGFDALAVAESTGGTTLAANSAAASGAQAAQGQGPQNGFRWSTHTEAAVWRSSRIPSARLVARAWWTRFAAGADWAADSGPVALGSGLSDAGIAGEMSWRPLSTLASAGVTVERISARYAVRRTGAPRPTDTTSSLAAFRSSLVVASAFLEDRWRAGAHWAFSMGVRDQCAPLGGCRLEPRAAVRFAPVPQLAFSAGYARMHQVVQSLRNEESILDAVVGIGLPVLAGAGGAPVAESDQLTLAVEAHPTATTTLALDWYARRLSGLVLVAPVTAQPFAMDSFARGSGRASGVTVSVEHAGARLFGRLAYSFTVTDRTSADLRYRPSFASLHALTAAAGYRLGAGTTVRAALWVMEGRPSSIVAGDLEGAPYGLLQGAGELAGSPQRIAGPLDGARLPLYARVDLGIRREWRARLLGRAADVTGSLTVGNVLGRRNTLGTVLSGDGRSPHAIPMLPRLVLLGLAWSF